MRVCVHGTCMHEIVTMWVYVHVCDVYVCVMCMCMCVMCVCTSVLVQMEVHISLLRKGCVRGGTSTLDLDQYATKVY